MFLRNKNKAATFKEKASHDSHAVCFVGCSKVQSSDVSRGMAGLVPTVTVLLGTTSKRIRTNEYVRIGVEYH